MGRIKGFFCSCLDNGADYSNGEATFDRNLDVSHLATPHTSANIDRSSTLNTCENPIQDKYPIDYSPRQPRTQQQQNHQNSLNQHDSIEPNINDAPAILHVRPPSSLNIETASSSQPSSASPFAPSPINNLCESSQQENHPNHAPVSPELQVQHNVNSLQDNVAQPQHPPPSPPPPPPPIAARNSPSTSNETTTKLSYDIISVREPLAKILAERQQLLQSQQQQRQILGDHEYIEVYGERGSSCFYEEIAGSVTSSVTYDQIGNASNHNYQVLINAYAVANRQPAANMADEIINRHDARSDGLPDSNNNQQEENAYDVTSHPVDQVDSGPSNIRVSEIESSENTNPASSSHGQASPNHPDSTRLTQSIPVYSVINKANRRSSSIMRAAFGTTRPPEPPPKNLFISQHQQPSTSAMNLYSANSISDSQHNNNSNSNTSRSPISQAPITNSYSELKHDPQNPSGDAPGNEHRKTRLPQPPPRYSKHPAFNHTTDRPLPSPNKLDSFSNNNNNIDLSPDRNVEEDDIESLNNGYELLKSNLDDDQIDVGYEKIRESNRYSGGSISSQFYPRHFIDNGGYESVQPIYSSPSNCYEVLNPATASEIAAAAAAKLNVIEKFLKKD